MSAALSVIAALCRALKLPTVARESEHLAGESERQGRSHLEFLQELLQAEVDERGQRRAARRILEAGLPLQKTLEGFDFRRCPAIPETRVRLLADGGYIQRAETVLLVGDPGTGKTHLAIGLAMAAARQGRSVRFVTAGRLANELVEARDAFTLARVVARYARVDLLVIDELGCPVPRTQHAEVGVRLGIASLVPTAAPGADDRDDGRRSDQDPGVRGAARGGGDRRASGGRRPRRQPPACR